ncbi:Uncharacterised protein [Shigella sonnei]|nr:Uncharacterised protein [Shigella sonnei]CSQ68491.1 Uncharacterised protein [Shigella sonnei]
MSLFVYLFNILGKGDACWRGRVFPGQATGEGERLMCAALLNAKAGLGADKLRAEQFTLARPFR